MTIDHVNPEAPWPEDRAARGGDAEPRPRARAAPPVYPEHRRSSGRPDRAPAVLRASDAARARARGRVVAGRADRSPRFACRATRCPLERPATSSGRTSSSALRARGDERQRVFAAADALRRERCGDDVTYVVTRNIQYTNVCYFRCGFCAFSKGKLAANLRGAPYLVPLDEIVRRCEEAWDRGATEVCLQGGIHPAFTGDYYLAVVRAIKAPCPELHVHAFSALEIWQGAATLGLPLEDYLRRLRDAGLASLPDGGRDPRRRGARGHLPRQGHDRAVAGGARVGAPRRPALERDDHVRPRRGPALVGASPPARRASSSGEAAASPSSCRCRSCTWRRRSCSRAARARADVRRDAARARGRAARAPPSMTNVQVSWVKLGEDGVAAALRAGVNDLGGTLMNESISRAAGAEHGQELPPERMEALIRSPAGYRASGRRSTAPPRAPAAAPPAPPPAGRGGPPPPAAPRPPRPAPGPPGPPPPPPPPPRAPLPGGPPTPPPPPGDAAHAGGVARRQRRRRERPRARPPQGSGQRHRALADRGVRPLLWLSRVPDLLRRIPVYLGELVAELRAAGVLAEDLEVSSVEELLGVTRAWPSAVRRRSSTSHRGDRRAVALARRARGEREALPSQEELARLYDGLRRTARLERRSLLEVSQGIGTS